MDCVGDQFLPRARFTHQQDGGIGWPDSLHILEDLSNRGTVADDLAEIAFVMNLLLQVRVFAGETILESIDFREGLGCLDRGRCLRRDRFQRLQSFGGETLATEHTEHTHELIPKQKGTPAERTNSLPAYPSFVRDARVR